MRRVEPVERGRAYERYALTMGTSRLALWLSRKVAWKLDPRLLRLTRGRVSFAMGIPTGLLETRGARTGIARRNAVIYFSDGDDAIVVASQAGAPTHPSWFFNLRANPDVVFAGEPMRAEIVEDESERQRLWALADRVFPAFAIYRERTSAIGRTIPVIRLRPS